MARPTRAQLEEHLARAAKFNRLPIELVSQKAVMKAREHATFVPVECYGPSMLPLPNEIGFVFCRRLLTCVGRFHG